MDTLFTGERAEWFRISQEKVEKINEKRKRSGFVSFSKKSYPFRIDEIMICLKTEEKIFVEHRKDEEPRIYVIESEASDFEAVVKKVYSSVEKDIGLNEQTYYAFGIEIERIYEDLTGKKL